MKARPLLRYLIATVLVLVAIPFIHRKPPVSATPFTGSHTRVLICTGKEFPRLSCGYVYDLVRRFSADARFSADIAFVPDSSWVDSLRTGAADLVAIDGTRQPDDSLQLAVSVPLPGNYVLAVPASDIARMQAINRYLHREQSGKAYRTTVQRYMRPYSPTRPGQARGPTWDPTTIFSGRKRTRLAGTGACWPPLPIRNPSSISKTSPAKGRWILTSCCNCCSSTVITRTFSSSY